MTTVIDRVAVVGSKNLMYIYPEGGITDLTSCATSSAYFVYRIDRPLAKEYLSLALAAQVSKQAVYIGSEDNCSDWPERETIQWLRIGD